jgi:tetratricopeptide (TPR) repeat protein
MQPNDDARKAINDVFRLINSGQIEQAESACRAHFQERPDDVNIVGLLGAILLKRGKSAEARETLLQAIALEPAFAKPYEDLGTLLLRDGDANEARRYLEESIKLDGGQASAYASLANACHQCGDLEAAEEAHRKFMALSPLAQTLAKAEQLLAAGQTAAAEKICEDLSKEHPTNTQALRMLARIASESGRHVVAEGLLKRIVSLSPDDYRCIVDLGLYLAEQGRYPEAVEALQKAADMNPRVIATQQRLGDFLAIMGKPAAALAVYETALQLDPDYVPALVGQGHMLRILGRSAEAVQSYEAGIALRPGFGDAWWSLASLRSYSFSDEQVAEMRKQIEIVNDDDRISKISFHFALARAAEEQQDFEAAWQYYERGNSLKRSAVQYDPVRIETSHDAVIKQFDEKFLEGFSSDNSDATGPIFIVGMPRSGSTLVEQILASHSLVEGAAELPYLGLLAESLGGPRSNGKKYPEVLDDLSAQQLLAFGKSYLYYSQSNRPQGLPRFTDKMPNNFVHVGLIHLALPNARIIDVRRDPLDVCIGNYRQLFAQGKNHAYDLNECAEYYLEYVRVMQHWDRVLPGRVLRVNYENIVANTEAEVRRLLDYCELPWEDACLNFHQTARAVNTASSEQVRVPIYRDAVGYWKHYESKLSDVKEILACATAECSQK